MKKRKEKVYIFRRERGTKKRQGKYYLENRRKKIRKMKIIINK